MGRRKIEIQPITDERNRTITFVKRKAGLFKKAHELAILCQVDLAVIILNNNNNNYYEFSSCNIDDLLTNYKNSPNIYESKHPENFGGESSHKRFSSTNSFQNNDSVGDDSDSDTEAPSKRHKRNSSDMTGAYGSQTPNISNNSSINNSGNNTNNNNNNNNNNSSINMSQPTFLDNRKPINGNNGNRHSKSASYSNDYNGVNNLSTVNANNSLPEPGYLVRPQTSNAIQPPLQYLQPPPQHQFQQLQQPQFTQFAQPYQAMNSYQKQQQLPYSLASKLSQLDSQNSNYNPNNNNNNNNPSHMLAPNFVFPPQKLPSLSNNSSINNNLLPFNSSNNPQSNFQRPAPAPPLGNYNTSATAAAITNSPSNAIRKLDLNGGVPGNGKHANKKRGGDNNNSNGNEIKPDLGGSTKSGSSTGTPVPSFVNEEDNSRNNNNNNNNNGLAPLSTTKHRATASINSNIPYSAASSPAFSHTARQHSSSSRPVLRVKIPEDSDSTMPPKKEDGESNKLSGLSGLTRDGDTEMSKLSPSASHNNTNNINNTNKNTDNSSSNNVSNSGSKSTPASATMPSSSFQFSLPNAVSSNGISNTNSNGIPNNGNNINNKMQPSLTTSNLPPATGGLLSSSIRPFLFNTGNGEQTPVSGLPSKYMNEFFPSPSNYYGEWSVGGASTGETPVRTTAGITLPLPSSLNGGSSGSSNKTGGSGGGLGDTSLGKHSLNNPNGSIKDELPSPIVMPSGGLPFGHLSKEKELKKKDLK